MKSQKTNEKVMKTENLKTLVFLVSDSKSVPYNLVVCLENAVGIYFVKNSKFKFCENFVFLYCFFVFSNVWDHFFG